MHAPSCGMALRLLGLCLSMHAVLLLLVSTAAAAAAADLTATGHARPHTAFDVDSTFAAAAVAAAAGRSLLHGSLKPWNYPTCPRCKLLTLRNGWWTGHCKSGGKLFTCRRSASSVARLAAPPPEDDAVLEVPPEETVGDVGSVIVDGEAPAPYVTCTATDECALPANEFTPVNGTAPTKVNGALEARCVFPDAEAAEVYDSRSGVCVCGYLVAATAETETADGVIVNATGTSTLDSDDAVVTEIEVQRGRGRTRTRKEEDGNSAGNTKEELVRVEDFCVREAQRVPGPTSQNRGQYRHVEHAEIGPDDTLARSETGGAEGGPDLTGVVISDGLLGEAVEVFDEDYGTPPADGGGGQGGGELQVEPAPSPPPRGRGRTRSRRRLLARDGDVDA